MSGCVTMYRTSMIAPWVVYLPDNSVLDTTGTHTSGLQEMLFWARDYGFNARLDAGGICPPSLGGINYAQIVCNRTLHILTTNVGLIDFGACSLILKPENPSDDGITIDSADMGKITGSGFIVYTGTGSAVHEFPRYDNGENFIGSCNNEIYLGDIVIGHPDTYLPRNDVGVGWRFSPQNGDMIHLRRRFNVNGGVVGVQVDNPTGAHQFNNNNLDIMCHGQGYASLMVGTSNTEQIWGNDWRFKASVAAGDTRGLVTHAVGDAYTGSIQGALIGVQEGGSAKDNRYVIPTNRSTTPFHDGSTAHTSKWL